MCTALLLGFQVDDVVAALIARLKAVLLMSNARKASVQKHSAYESN